jgi:hypothetical protein
MRVVRKRYIRKEQKMLARAKVFSLMIAALLVLTLMPGAPTTAAPTRTRISRIDVDAFDSETNGLSNPAHPLFSTADAQNVEFVGHIGGVTHAVAVQGSYAYIGEGPRLTILDISNPASPIVVGKTPPMPSLVQAITVADGYAYVTADWAGLRVVDVSDPTNPIEIAYNNPCIWALDVAVTGDYVYLAGSSGLRVIDVSIPSNPTEVGAYNTPGYARGVAVAGGYAYVADSDEGLRVVDISSPSNPTEVGFFDTPGYAYDVAVVGGYAYVVDSRDMRVLDVSAPANPTEVGVCDTVSGGAHTGIVIVGDYAYVADNIDVAVVDVSMPSDPTEVGTGSTPGNAEDIAVAGAYAYVADRNSGLRVVDISNVEDLAEVAAYDVLGEATSIVLDGHIAYVADQEDGLRVLDVSDPHNPSELGFYSMPGWAEDVAVAEDYAYVASQGEGVHLIDISNPADPTQVGMHELFYAQGVTVVGDYAYVAAAWDFRVLDVSQPSDPTEVGLLDGLEWASDVAVSGGYAYVADDESGLRIVDVSSPSQPVQVGLYDTPGEAEDIAVAGRYAYVADGNGGLRVVNISDPGNPSEVGFYDDPLGPVYGVTTVDGFAYVANGFQGGLRVLDISTPSTPTEIGAYDTASYAADVAVAGDYVYVASCWGGLYVLRYAAGDDTTPPTIDVYAGKSNAINRNLCLGPVLSSVGATIREPPSADWQSGLDWVRLYYNLNGGSESYVELDLDGETWTNFGHMMGPFDDAGVVSWYIRAQDMAGNPNQSSSYLLTVNDCPYCVSWTTEVPTGFTPAGHGFKFENFGGTCAGMSAAALDFFEYEQPIPDNDNYWGMPEDGPDNPLWCYIVSRHLEANDKWEDYWVDRILESWLFVGRDRQNQREYDKILARIRDESKPAIIGLGTKKHVVDVYAVSECQDRVVLYTYDPNMVLQVSGAYPHLIEGTKIGSAESYLHIDRATTVYDSIFAIFAAPAPTVNPTDGLSNCDSTVVTLVDRALEETSAVGYVADSASILKGTLSQGEQSVTYPFFVEDGTLSAVIVSWMGSTLRLSVYRPDGSLFDEIQGSQSPLVVTVTSNEVSGVWNYRVTAVSVPQDDYPYITLIGRKYFYVYLPAVLKSW